MSEIREIVIPKEQAVFRMDQQGCWNNVHGKFRNKKIIDHFNASIRRDTDGYFLTQINGDIREKVYFPYEDTVFFVTDLRREKENDIRLILNTKEEIRLIPEKLFIRNDNLYLQKGEDLIRFSERALIRISDLIGYEDGQYFFQGSGIDCRK